MIAALLALALGQTAPGDADFESPGVAVDLLRPALGSGRTAFVELPERLPGFTTDATLAWIHRPLVYVTADGERVPVLGDAAALHLGGAAQWGPVRLGAQVPVYAVADGALDGGLTVGDPCLDAVAVVRDGAGATVGVAVAGRLGIPLGGAEQLVGQPGFSGELGVVADADGGPAFGAVQVGARFVPDAGEGNLAQADLLVLRAALGVAPGERFTARVELAGQTPIGRPFGDRWRDPFELAVGGSVRVGGHTVITASIGTGITPSVGSPAVRALIGLRRSGDPGQDTEADATRTRM